MIHSKYLQYSFITLAAFTLYSCEDVLEEVPETQFSDVQLFSTEAGVEGAVTGIYEAYASFNYHGNPYHTLLAPISGKFYSSQGASEDATSLNCQPNNINLARLWPGMYTTINRANLVIANVEGNTALANRDLALGQAYFLRASTYFDMVQLFGDVPLKTEPTEDDNLFLPRSNKDLVYDLIIEDLQRAEQLLPEPGGIATGRPSKYAAIMILAKVYMRLAGEDGGDPTLWNNARDEALKVFGQFSLTPTYAELFRQGNENTVESIFEIQYGQNGVVRTSDKVRNYTPRNSVFAPDGQFTFGRVRPNKEVWDDHNAQYPTDPRIDAIFVANEYLLNDGSTQRIYPDRNNGNNGYVVLAKYFDSDYNGSTTSRNFIKLRYADLLLMLAEIENEINGPSGAYAYVNEVLARARNTENGVAAEPADWSGMTQDEFRTRILKERQYELLGEGHEWYDTRRRGYDYFLEEVVLTHNNNPNQGNRDYVYPTDPKNMLLPIPTSEISANAMISTDDQNPGY